MPRSVLDIGAFLEKKILARIGKGEHEGAIGRGVENPLLDQIQLDIENLLELFGSQRLEGNDLIEAVHEFGRELFPRRFNAASGKFSGSFFIAHAVGGFLASFLNAEAEPR